MKNQPQMFGDFAKHNTSGKILKVVRYDNEGVDLELPTGEACFFPRHEVGRITADEELDFLRSRLA